jgi:Type VII secretion system ESX-1, transport TM domain B
MPRNDSSCEQVSGRQRLFYRLSLAMGRCRVRHSYGSAENDVAALPVLAVGAILIVGLCFILAIFNPAGQIASSQVLAQVAGGGLYDTAEGYR